VLKEIDQKLANAGSDEERKKLMGEKSKYVVRLNKIIEHTKPRKQVSRPKKIKELKKVYAYCVEGSLEELEYIWGNLKSGE
jgi:other hect domain ubiquitin protein ligase E3